MGALFSYFAASLPPISSRAESTRTDPITRTLFALLGFVFFASLFKLLRGIRPKTTARTRLRTFWRSWRFVMVAFGGLLMGYVPLRALVHPSCPSTLANQLLGLGCAAVLSGSLFAPMQRGRVRAILARLAANNSDEVQRAAAVSELTGDIGRDRALEEAKSHFRVLPFTALRERDLTTHSDTGLNKLTHREELGCCDSFVSHSWSDDGKEKFAALSEWAQRFVERHARTPTLWLDKACIDQQDIKFELAMLPVFLAGCRTMLVIAGLTCESAAMALARAHSHGPVAHAHAQIEHLTRPVHAAKPIGIPCIAYKDAA